MVEHDAVLTDWMLGIDGDLTILLGVVAADSKPRFKPNATIHSSLLRTPREAIKEGAVVQTLNTRYLLGRAASEVPDKVATVAAILRVQPTLVQGKGH